MLWKYRVQVWQVLEAKKYGANVHLDSFFRLEAFTCQHALQCQLTSYRNVPPTHCITLLPMSSFHVAVSKEARHIKRVSGIGEEVDQINYSLYEC